MLPLVEKQFKIRSRFNSMLHLQKKHITEKNTKDKKIKVTDQWYLTGTYRGATHIICNLRFDVPNEVLVFFTMNQTITITSS